jgi:hypothetical protein
MMTILHVFHEHLFTKAKVCFSQRSQARLIIPLLVRTVTDESNAQPIWVSLERSDGQLMWPASLTIISSPITPGPGGRGEVCSVRVWDGGKGLSGLSYLTPLYTNQDFQIIISDWLP